MKPTIYTVGHSTRSIEELVNLLKRYGIQQVIDVRRFPSSKKYPHFNKENLSQKLKEEGIHYVWLGEILGGYRNGGYEKYMQTSQYQMGIKTLIQLAENKTSALLCSEKLWFKCHRRHIAETLTKMGWHVIHIIELNRTYVHKLRSK